MFLGDDKHWPLCTDHNGDRKGTCNTNVSPGWGGVRGDAYGDGLYCCGVAPVLPASKLPENGWYDIDSLDATTRSQIAHGTTLTFTQLRERGQVLPQGDYQIWYGEALTGHTTSDNGGESCVDVYVCGARQQLAECPEALAVDAGLSCADAVKPDSASCPRITAALQQLLPVNTPPLVCIYGRQLGTSSNAADCSTVAAALNALDDVEGFRCIYCNNQGGHSAGCMLVSDSCPTSIVALGQMVSGLQCKPHQIVCPVSETGEVQLSWIDYRKPHSRSLALSRSLYICLPFCFPRFSFFSFLV